MTIRERRNSISWSQQRMATRLDLSLSTYCRHEAAERKGKEPPVWLQLAVEQAVYLAKCH